jgi:hypothetical protein
MVAVLIFTDLPPAFRTGFAVPSLALESAMTCRVFKDLKLGSLKDYDEVSIKAPTSTAPSTRPHFKSDTGVDAAHVLHGLTGAAHHPVTVSIPRATKEWNDDKTQSRSEGDVQLPEDFSQV